MADAAHIAIIGGGVIGLSTAYFLAREGAKVTLIDKGDFGQEASWAGAGILPPENLADARTPIELLRAHSAALFPSLSAELRKVTGIDNGYTRCGGLEFARPAGEAAGEEWHAAGVPLQRLDEREVAKLEPALASGLGPAYHLPEMAQVRNPRHVKALTAACGLRGVRLLPGTPAQGFRTSSRGVTAVNTAAGAISADRFLIAAGAWSEPLLQGLGWTPGIRPVRGQIVLLQPEAPVFRHILLWGSRYLVPRGDGRVLIGSTEENVGFNKHTTAGAVADLIELGASLVPGLAAAAVERCWAGLRPGSPDGLPYLGAVPGWDNVFVGAGHFRAGLHLSPGTALVLKECLLDQPLTIPLVAFRLDRST